MTKVVDLILLPIYRRSGEDHADLPGLYVADQPRRPARSRSKDQLILFTQFLGGVSYSQEEIDKILRDLAKNFYKTSGSVTSALRVTAESFHERLRKLNSQKNLQGQPVIGLITQIVWRDEQIFLAQSGPMHAYLINGQGSEHIYDPSQSGSGLGTGGEVLIKYFHASLAANDTLVVASQPAPQWDEETLAKAYGQGPESMRRRLLSTCGPDAIFLITQARTGNGNIHLLQSTTSVPVSVPESAQDSSAQAAGAAAAAVGAVTAGAVTQESMGGASSADGGPVSMQDKHVTSTDTTATTQPGASPEVSVSHPETTDTPRKKRITLLDILLFPVNLILRPLVLIIDEFAKLFGRVIPNETLASISNTTMAFIALVVPVVIVGIATAVYIQRGVAAQSEVIYEQALELVDQAESETDILAQRAIWQALIEHLDNAETLYSNPDAMALRNKAENALDSLDMVERADYQPAIVGGLPDSANITRILIGDSELFLLDEQSGSVIHATFTDQGYIIDQGFQCGPGYPGVEKPLIDIVSWPAGFEPSASVMGLDSEGGVVYCAPGQDPEAGQLAKPQLSDLTNISGAVMELGNLYILDPDANAVWIYWNGETSQEPSFFFGDQIPRLDDVVDLIANNDDLYLLHADGHLTLCQFSWLKVSPTRCIEPVEYLDTRPGRENSVLIPENPFSKILYNPPPDPSLYLLDPDNQSMYHFSLRNPTFQKQYVPEDVFSGGYATAFAVDSFNRILFLAVGDDVYYARIP